MRNYIDELSPQVYLPLKYLDEFKAAHESELSFPYFSELVRLPSDSFQSIAPPLRLPLTWRGDLALLAK